MSVLDGPRVELRRILHEGVAALGAARRRASSCSATAAACAEASATLPGAVRSRRRSSAST